MGTKLKWNSQNKVISLYCSFIRILFFLSFFIVVVVSTREEIKNCYRLMTTGLPACLPAWLSFFPFMLLCRKISKNRPLLYIFPFFRFLFLPLHVHTAGYIVLQEKRDFYYNKSTGWVFILGSFVHFSRKAKEEQKKRCELGVHTQSEFLAENKKGIFTHACLPSSWIS